MMKILLVLSLSVVLSNKLVCSDDSNDDVASYAKVAISGSNHESGDGPKIFKSLHSDLLPMSDPIQTSQATEDSKLSEKESTGRAYMDGGSFPLSFGRYPRPQLTRFNSRPRIVYPAYRPSYKRVGQTIDRYTPGEATATAYFKKKNKQAYDYSPPKIKPTLPRPRPGTGYVPPKDLYAFPPNLDANYLPPSKPPSQVPSGSINSYRPPPAGPAFDGFNSYAGPVSPDYLPPFLSKPKEMESPPKLSEMPKENTKPEPMSAVPSDDMPPANDSDDQPPPDYPGSDDDGREPGLPMVGPTENGPPMDDAPPMDGPPMDGSDNASMEDSKPSMLDSDGPPDSADAAPMIPNDHYPDHHDHHGHSFYGSHGIDAYPEVIFDHDHDHSFIHDHDHHHPEEMTTTMKPEPPPEPRVKKYSYFYLGRKLWYIPLYFTVWFSFYIFWLIIKSIARHKVNLPNHYTGRMMVKRSFDGDLTHKEIVESVDELTASVMTYIDEYEKKLL